MHYVMAPSMGLTGKKAVPLRVHASFVWTEKQRSHVLLVETKRHRSHASLGGTDKQGHYVSTEINTK